MIDTANNEQLYFPTKKQMLSKMSLPTVELVSNHFAVDFSRSISFNEWLMAFYSIDDKDRVLNNDSHLSQSLAPDSRIIIDEVLRANRSEIRSALGKYFHSGLSLFTFLNKESIKDRYVFQDHKQHILVLTCTHRDLNPASLNHEAAVSTRNIFMRILNSFLKSILAKMGYKAFGRLLKFYDMKNYVDVPDHRLHIYKGFVTAIDVYEGGLKLLVDYSTKIVRSRNVMRELRHNDISLNDIDRVKEYCIGMLVMASYGNNRMYRIDDVDFETTAGDPFPGNEYRDYEDYYVKRYKTPEFMYKDKFLLVNKSRRIEIDANGEEVTRFETIRLVPELMFPTGLTDEMRKDYKVMRDIGQHTILHPDKRFPLIDKFTKETNREISSNKDFNFIIDRKSNKVKGYMIKPPAIRTGLRCSTPKQDRIIVDKAIKIKTLTDWIIIYDLGTERNVKNVVSHLQKAGQRFDFKISNPVKSILMPRHASENDIKQMISSAKCPNLDFVFFLVGKDSVRNGYRRAKRYLQRKGIASQFLTSYNPHKDDAKPSKFLNIVSQMIVKTGGSVWEIELDIPGTIVAGADVYHGPKGQSVASLVTQWGRNFSEFYSVPKIQKKGVEIMHNMSSMVLDSIKEYKHRTKRLPKNFIFFRDGVGEGQLEAVIKYEIKKIKQKLEDSYKEEAPKLLFVVVTKRISDRFVVDNGGRLDNPDGGIVVLDDVVKPDKANFYLIAQRVNQGTATPTHYEVIYNDTAFKLEELIDIAYKFTFGYSNWMGPVKVPAPVQYAHKQAALIGVTQDDYVSSDLLHIRHFM